MHHPFSCQRRPVLSGLFLILAVFLPSSLAAAPVNLAKTGQTLCYGDAGANIPCKGTGQDGEYQAGVAWPSPRFVPDGVVVTDNLTGLVWTKAAREAGFEYACIPGSGTTAFTWEQAYELVDCLNSKAYGSFSDWRVPNVLEMHSLINLQDEKGLKWLEKEGFIDATGSFWTSTTSPSNGLLAYTVNYFHPGSTSVNQKSSTNGIWPVRGTSRGPGALMKTGQTQSYHAHDDGALQMGASWVEPRFEIEGECILDVQTGLMWTKSVDIAGGNRPFGDAISLAGKGKYCGYSGWRVPNQKELLSMIHFGKAPGVDWLKSAGFKGVKQDAHIWSSSAYAYQTNSVWALFMQSSFNIYAEVKQKGMHFENAVWLVRTVPPEPPSVTGVVPSQGPNDYPVTIYVNGSGFSQGDAVFLGTRQLSTYYSSSKQLAAYVPMALTPGEYEVTVKTVYAAEASLSSAFTVLPPNADDLFADTDEFKSSRQIEFVGEPTTLTLLVRRFGGVSALSNLNVRFFEGANASGKLISTGTIPTLLPFSSAPVAVAWTPGSAGFNLVTAAIDVPPGETSPATNTVTMGVQVVKLKPTATPRPTATPAPAKPTATPRPTPTPQVPDMTAPVIESFEIDGGALNNTNGSMTFSFRAADPGTPGGTASGVAWVYYTVWEFYAWANDWFVTDESGWLFAKDGGNTRSYSPGYFSGPRIVSLWVADAAQNVSKEVSRVINYIKPDDYVFQGESRWYIYPLNAGEAMYASCFYRMGDADLYLWPPDWQTRSPWASLYSNPDIVSANIPVDGYYWLEVFGYEFAEFDLTVTLGLLPAAMSSASISTSRPKTEPGISMSLPYVVRRLQPNTEAFKVTLSSPKNGASVRPAKVSLKWRKMYLGKTYTVQTSRNGRRWKNAGRSKKNSIKLRNLVPGKTYYWRVKGTGPLSPAGVWSDSRSFRVRKR